MLTLCGRQLEPVWTEFGGGVTRTAEWRRTVNEMGEIPVPRTGSAEARCRDLQEDGVSLAQREFNAFCAGLPATTHVVQWGGADVWKVGGKVFAIGAWDWGKHSGITFKVSDIAWEMLRDAAGCRPAPYLASRGMKWIQRHDRGLGKTELKQYLKTSHALVAAGLTRKKRAELGL